MRAENLAALVQMPQITATVVEAGIAAASLFDRRSVLGVRRISDVDDPLPGEQMRIARMPGRHHAIEHVDASAHRFDDVLRPPHAHEVPRFAVRHLREQCIQNLVAFCFGLPHRQTADREAAKSDLLQGRKRFEPQRRINTALHDAEQRSRRLAGVVRAKSAQRPAHGQFHGDARLSFRRRVGCALIETHGHIGTQRALNAHGLFRG